MSNYVKAVAQSVTVRRLHEYAASLSDGESKEQVPKEALNVNLQAQETAVHAKVMLLAFADCEALRCLARWDRNPAAGDLVNSTRFVR
jgi:asparagine synthetase A